MRVCRPRVIAVARRTTSSKRQNGAFYRTVTLSGPVDTDKAQAHFEHGILHLTLPKQIRISGQALEQRTEQQQGQQGETH